MLHGRGDSRADKEASFNQISAHRWMVLLLEHRVDAERVFSYMRSVGGHPGDHGDSEAVLLGLLLLTIAMSNRVSESTSKISWISWRG